MTHRPFRLAAVTECGRPATVPRINPTIAATQIALRKRNLSTTEFMPDQIRDNPNILAGNLSKISVRTVWQNSIPLSISALSAGGAKAWPRSKIAAATLGARAMSVRVTPWHNHNPLVTSRSKESGDPIPESRFATSTTFPITSAAITSFSHNNKKKSVSTGRAHEKFDLAFDTSRC